jgi:hypothetical protein
MYVDSECRSMMILAENLDPEQIAPVWPRIRKGIMDRIQMCESGRLAAPGGFEKRLREIDPLLTLRWDFWEGCYVVDRWTASERCYTTILVWKDEFGPKHLDNSMIEALHEADTWRFRNWREYLAYKRAKAAKRRAQIKQQGDERLKAAVDSLTRARAQNFMEVEQALQTGETVVAHGATEKSLEHMHSGALQARERGEYVGLPAAKVIRPRLFKKGIQ